MQQDCERALGFLAAVLVDARRLGVEPDEAVEACVAVLRSWVAHIVTKEEPEPPE